MRTPVRRRLPDDVLTIRKVGDVNTNEALVMISYIQLLFVTFSLERKSNQTCLPAGRKFKDNPIAPRVCPANTSTYSKREYCCLNKGLAGMKYRQFDEVADKA